MASPVAKVLGTYELLEKILLNLSAKNLFGLQRISRAWKSDIDQSHPLRKKMFLMADGEPVKPNEAEIYRGCLRLNPVVNFDLCELGSSYAPEHAWTISTGRTSLEYTIRRAFFCGDYDDVFDITVTEPWSGNSRSRGFTCMDMFLTQPPITALRHATIYNPNGLTFRDALKGKDRILQAYEGASKRDGVFTGDLSFYLAVPEDEERKRAYEQCTFPEDEVRESCGCSNALFGPRS